MAVPVQREWVTVREAMEITGLSRTTLWSIYSAGEVRAAKVGKAVRINRRSLEEYRGRQDYVESIKP
jgi:excisionase family DNA binding protein